MVAIEDDVLPHLVADDIGIKTITIGAQELEFAAAETMGRRVVGRGDQHQFRSGIEYGGEIGLVEGPVRRVECHDARHTAGAADQWQIGVVHRLEDDDLVARRDQAEDSGTDGLGRAGGDNDLFGRVERKPLRCLVKPRHGFTQHRQAAHRRVLVRLVHQRAGSSLAHLGEAIAFRETLTEIDGAQTRRLKRHDLENGGREIGKDWVHAPCLPTMRAIAKRRRRPVDRPVKKARRWLKPPGLRFETWRNGKGRPSCHDLQMGFRRCQDVFARPAVEAM